MNKKTIAIISTFMLITIILRFCFVFESINHDCTHDDNCPICDCINNLNRDFNGIVPKIIICILIIFYQNIKEKVHKFSIYLSKQKQTLIGLKVQLNN